ALAATDRRRQRAPSASRRPCGGDPNGTIESVGPTTGTGTRYDTAISELWSGLARTLSELDVAASEPEVLDQDDAATALRRLQYRLHLAREDAFGLRPPAGAETAHAELSAALKDARD